MDLNVVQKLNQEQKLILTSEMQLSLRLLQMPIYELQNYINTELEENPVLEAEVDADAAAEEGEEVLDGTTSPLEYGDKIQYDELVKGFEYEDYEGNFHSIEEAKEYDPFMFTPEKKTLKQFLRDQLLEIKEDKQVIEICEYMIESINENGYLDEDLCEIADILKVCVKTVEYSFGILQNFNPAGIGARNLKDCLKIQIKKMGITDTDLYKIIDEYLELVAENKVKEIAKKLNLGVKEVQEHIALIKSLEPRPSRGFFTGDEIKYAAPEAYIRKIGIDYFILLNDSLIPRLNINNVYREIMKKKDNPDAEEFIKNKIDKAVYLIKAIEQRKNTIYRVLDKIIQRQRDYFDKGLKFLKPMTIKDIAEGLELHESTVSRAIKDKYISTPAGTLKIKDMFTGGMTTVNNTESISTKVIKEEITRLIDGEDKSAPLSDELISSTLKEINMKVSRRTVAKYREEMGINPSYKRRLYET